MQARWITPLARRLSLRQPHFQATLPNRPVRSEQSNRHGYWSNYSCLLGAAGAALLTTAVVYADGNELFMGKSEAETAIVDALKAAQDRKTRVLVVWGANSDTSYPLVELLTGHSEIRSIVQLEYELVFVNGSSNPDLVARYKGSAGPSMSIVGADGEVVVSAVEVAKKLVSASICADDLLSLLKANKITLPSTQEVIAHAKEIARRDGKLVWVQFGASWCGYSRKFMTNLTHNLPLFESAFVLAYLDLNRNSGAKEALEKCDTADGGGVPFYCILDADGEVCASSINGSEGNIGYPSLPADLEHLRTMLEKGNKLNAGSVNVLVRQFALSQLDETRRRIQQCVTALDDIEAYLKTLE